MRRILQKVAILWNQIGEIAFFLEKGQYFSYVWYVDVWILDTELL